MIVLHVRGGKGRGGGRIRNKVKGNQILLTYSIGSLSRTNAGGAAHCAGAQAYPQHHFTVGNSQGGGARGVEWSRGFLFALLFVWQNKTKLGCFEVCIQNEIVFFRSCSSFPFPLSPYSLPPSLLLFALVLWVLLPKTNMHRRLSVCVCVYVFVCCFICIYCCTFLFFFRLSLLPFSRAFIGNAIFMFHVPSPASRRPAPPSVRRKCSLTPHIFVYDNILLRLSHVAAVMCSSLLVSLSLSLLLPVWVSVCDGVLP